jgi:exodeoxyribonuclease VII large subunit
LRLRTLLAGAELLMPNIQTPALTPRIWQVSALCRAIADALEARFNPVAVLGEISGFSRASSGHCYFSLKDEQGQIRCAMFRRAASLLDFAPKDGELVEMRGRLGVYEPRGELQLIVESMSRAGQGALFKQFLRLKTRLEAEGLFDQGRKRPLPVMPRGIGVVTSLGAAALHDVVAALRRRVPHIPVIVSPAVVQGAAAPAELIRALQRLWPHSQPGTQLQPVDVVLLVRGGGSIEDLWAFNDEQLARAIVQSPVPVISGVGHETDFSIADFCADLRAPTPTAAAELVSQPREVWLGALSLLAKTLLEAAHRKLDTGNQRLDHAAARMGRPSGLVARQQMLLERHAQRLHYTMKSALEVRAQKLSGVQRALAQLTASSADKSGQRLQQAALRLQLLDPKLVLQRGFAWLSDSEGRAITSARQAMPGQAVLATLADGEVDLTVSPRA